MKKNVISVVVCLAFSFLVLSSCSQTSLNQEVDTEVAANKETSIELNSGQLTAKAYVPGVPGDIWMGRYYRPGYWNWFTYTRSDHWVTTNAQPSGYRFENSWRIGNPAGDPVSPSIPVLAQFVKIYECSQGSDHFISKFSNCEGQTFLKFAGYVDKSGGPAGLYRCYDAGAGDHFVSDQSNCEGRTTEYFLGYTFPEVRLQ